MVIKKMKSNDKKMTVKYADIESDYKWWVGKGDCVQGPYSDKEIKRYLVSGRIRPSDRLSTDGYTWEPATQIPELVPDELLTHQWLEKYMPDPDELGQPYVPDTFDRLAKYCLIIGASLLLGICIGVWLK